MMYRNLVLIIFIAFSLLDFCFALDNTEVSEQNESAFFQMTGTDEEMLTDSLVAYLNQQDWSYLKAKNDWGWYGDIILLFNKKGFIKKVKSDFHSGYTHKDDIYLRTADRLKRQVRKTLKQRDLSHLDPPSEYIISIALNYTSANREVVWSRGDSTDVTVLPPSISAMPVTPHGKNQPYQGEP